MISFHKKPATKKLEDFEQIEINLIQGLPFEYGFVFKGSNRVIQKASHDELEDAIKEYPGAIEYIKVGPKEDFVLFKTLPEYKDVSSILKFKNAKNQFITGWVALPVGILLAVGKWNPEKSFWEQAILILVWLAVIHIIVGGVGMMRFRSKT